MHQSRGPPLLLQVEDRATLLVRSFGTDEDRATLGVQSSQEAAQERAERDAEADQKRQRLADEIESLKARIINDTGLSERNLGWWMRDWRKERLNDEQVRVRLRRNLESRLAKQAAEEGNAR
ncbi:MAG: hypothetical protein ACRDRJ_05030 [Streptosporangiaceae bacterium]